MPSRSAVFNFRAPDGLYMVLLYWKLPPFHLLTFCGEILVDRFMALSSTVVVSS